MTNPSRRPGHLGPTQSNHLFRVSTWVPMQVKRFKQASWVLAAATVFAQVLYFNHHPTHLSRVFIAIHTGSHYYLTTLQMATTKHHMLELDVRASDTKERCSVTHLSHSSKDQKNVSPPPRYPMYITSKRTECLAQAKRTAIFLKAASALHSNCNALPNLAYLSHCQDTSATLLLSIASIYVWMRLLVVFKDYQCCPPPLPYSVLALPHDVGSGAVMHAGIWTFVWRILRSSQRHQNIVS